MDTAPEVRKAAFFAYLNTVQASWIWGSCWGEKFGALGFEACGFRFCLDSSSKGIGSNERRGFSVWDRQILLALTAS